MRKEDPAENRVEIDTRMAKLLNSQDRARVRELVQHFQDNRHLFEGILGNLSAGIQSSKVLANYIHSTKTRLKDPEHLRDKLDRKLSNCKREGKVFDISKENLFRRVNDLAGFRILHLYTHEIEHIDRGLQELFSEEHYRVREGPAARTWDDESRAFFSKIGIKTIRSPSLYTSIHYVIEPNRKTPCTCEIQVRTLIEEVWGEVDHAINYPHLSKSLSCREQIKVLARLTSSCTRLVDSIFASDQAQKASGGRET